MSGNLIWILLAVFVILLLFYGYLSNYRLTVENYSIGSGKLNTDSLRIVMLADLHGGMFGKQNQRLIQKIKEQKPNVICLAGDMTVKNGKGTDSCLALCQELLKICSVIYAPGNHEIRMEYYETYLSRIKEMGVIWLDNEARQFCLKGKNVCFYGLNLPEEFYHKVWEKRNFTDEILRQLLGTPKADCRNILLAHNPEYFSAYSCWGADLVLSGHVHGGIARLPLVGGVIAPSLRIFPKYTGGMYKMASAVMVLSRGLGTHHIRLRFFNPPEISVINVLD